MRLEHEVLHRARLLARPYVAPRGVELVGFHDVGREAVADLERRPVPAPEPPVAVTPRVVALAPALEVDPLLTDEQLAVHHAGVLVVGAWMPVRVRVVV